MPSIITPKVVHYCAQECHWQMSGERSVAYMMEAWRHAHRLRHRPITVDHIVELGRKLEPHKNVHGLRRSNVRVGNAADGRDAPHHSEVPNLLAALVSYTPEDPTHDEAARWFKTYEEIHPFVDGNGRSGSLLHLWLIGRLDNPIHAPNVFADPRRAGFEGYPEVGCD